MTTSQIMYAMAEWVNGVWQIDWAFPLSYTAKERLETVAQMNSQMPGRYAQIAVEVTVVPTYASGGVMTRPIVLIESPFRGELPPGTVEMVAREP